MFPVSVSAMTRLASEPAKSSSAIARCADAPMRHSGVLAKSIANVPGFDGLAVRVSESGHGHDRGRALSVFDDPRTSPI